MRRNTIFWGILLILVGLLFLLDNLGFLSIDVWNLIWPLFLIALGIWVLYGYLVRPDSESEHVLVDLEGANEARLRIRHGAGRLNIFSGAPSGSLLEGDFAGGLDLNKNRSGDRLDLELQVPSQAFPFMWGSSTGMDWSLGLNREVALSLILDTGANDARIDLAELLVKEFVLSSGASSTRVTLPAAAGYTRVEVKSGVASVYLHVPEGVAARIRTQGGLASIQVDSRRFPQSGSYYQSPDYETAAHRVDISAETGVGSIEIV